MKRRYAAHFIYESPSSIHKQCVIELEDGKVIAIFPLTGEIASTIWLDGVIILSSHSDYKLKPEYDFPTLLSELCNGQFYAYHLSPIDMTDLKPKANTILKRL